MLPDIDQAPSSEGSSHTRVTAHPSRQTTMSHYQRIPLALPLFALYMVLMFYFIDWAVLLTQ